uniref:Uncharacterized protein n=1 Tax=Echinococcus granulosus TaxID=6210 RepID=A0A068WPI6_ECHGR|nr:hypothetical protein EgrG_002025200 [Echinococcus granulosus]
MAGGKMHWITENGARLEDGTTVAPDTCLLDATRRCTLEEPLRCRCRRLFLEKQSRLISWSEESATFVSTTQQKA